MEAWRPVHLDSSSSYAPWLIHVCDMTHSNAWQDSFICVTWLIYMCDMTRSYVWHDSFICVTWLVHMCDMTRSYVWHGCLDEGGTDMCSTHMFFHWYVLSLMCSFTDMLFHWCVLSLMCSFTDMLFHRYVLATSAFMPIHIRLISRIYKCVMSHSCAWDDGEMTEVCAKAWDDSSICKDTATCVCVRAHTPWHTCWYSACTPATMSLTVSPFIATCIHTNAHTQTHTHVCTNMCVYVYI